MKSLLLLALTALADADTLRWLAVGDWGGQSTPPYFTDVQSTVAAGMAKVAEARSTQYIAGVGDNFYDDGISCKGDPSPGCRTDALSHRFQDTFEKVYTAPSLQVPWFFHAGNHDHHATANVTAQVAYTQLSKRWNFPSLYYTVNQTFAPTSTGRNVTVQWLFIDTVLLCGLSTPNRPELPPTPWHNVQETDDQLTWIDDTLAASTADFVFVTGHYPVWSVAEHGTTQCLVDTVLPLLKQHEVALYLNGHDHNLQFLDDGSGIAFLDCGAGHDYDTSQAHNSTVPAGSLKFYAAPQSGGFCALEVLNATHFQIDLFDGEATPLYSRTWANPRAA